MSKDTGMSKFFNRGKPFFAVIFLQLGLAGMDIISKVALNEGMSNYVYGVYRHAVATIVITPFAIVFDKPVIDQNLYLMGMKATTATFATAMYNVLPAITFVMACFLRLEKLNGKSIRSQAKVIGTVTTVAGAMMMTLMKGPILELFWTKEITHQELHVNNGADVDLHHYLMGAIMITVGCFSSSAFMVLQAITLKSYPAELSLTAWILLVGISRGSDSGVDNGGRKNNSLGYKPGYITSSISKVFLHREADRDREADLGFSPLDRRFFFIEKQIEIEKQIWVFLH
ncbi:hypothetical protein L6452_24517 [Arctium lappa]|uniref:Uncharacterized protein n=1 Tax=Arctium lappa TaxID=4217 RepID=A0ACB9A9H8_ARCLA|nr:hypothetical protein L6452_24517 [Arctium lappa]